jgi:hypothetical protein
MTQPGLILLPQRLAVCRLNACDSIPGWAEGGSFVSMTRTAEELSVVCEETLLPQGVLHQGGWRCLQVVGPLDFALVGVLSGIAAVLAQAGVSIFAISTYDTDYILLQAVDLTVALAALQSAGYSITPV